MNADRNLLLGVIALQNNFIDRHQLVTAFDRWVSDKRLGLAELLVESKAISSQDKGIIEALVDRHLRQHGGDPQASLIALSQVGSVVNDLGSVRDRDLHASLIHLASPGDSVRKSDPMATMLPSVGATTSNSLRFRVLRPHATGGLGEVFVAQDDELNRRVALKQIRETYADNVENRARFVVEAEITGALEHPGIVPIYGMGHYADGRPYYAMRFIRGDSLHDALKAYHIARKARTRGGDNLALRGLLGRFVDVCDAIEYAHCRGILHRDLKPGNIMLGRFGETLVVDWGLARTLDSMEESTSPNDEELVRPASSLGSQPTLMGSAVGTPHYMSPEQAAGRLDILGPRSDVYSLGATLYCVLTGEPPVEGDNVGELLQRVQRGNIRPPRTLNPGIDRGLDAICLKALSLDPANRYSRAAELAADVQRWLADEPVQAYREGMLARAGRWARRHRGLVSTIAAMASIAIVALSLSLWFISAARQREAIAHQRAQESFQMARAAVDRYFTQVSEETLLNQPGLQTLRRDLLLDALTYYESFAKQHETDQELQGDVAKSSYNIGRIHEELGQTDQSLESYRQATKAQRAQLTTRPNDVSLMEGLSDTLNATGRVKHASKGLAECLAFYSEAAEIRKTLATQDPNNPEYQRKLANSHMNIGLAKKEDGKIDEAEQEMEQAQSIRAPYAKDRNQFLLRRDCAKGSINLGELCEAKGDTDSALKHYLQGIELFTELVEQRPTDLEIQLLLSLSERTVGELLTFGENPASSLAHFEHAIGWLQSLSNRNPEVPSYQTNLASVYMSKSFVERMADNKTAYTSIASAIQVLRECEKKGPHPMQQRDLAVALRIRAELNDSDPTAALKDLEESVRLLEALVAAHPDDQDFDQRLRESITKLHERNVQ